MANQGSSAGSAAPAAGGNNGAIAVLVLAMLAGSAFLIVQGYHIFNFEDPATNHVKYTDGTVLALGIVSLVITFAVIVVCLQLNRLGSGTGSEQASLSDSARDALMLSDTAKRIIYRERDRQALRRAIREDIDKRDYEGALTMVAMMSQVYGHRIEAEQFRSEIEVARAVEQEKKIDEAIRNVDQMIARHDFEAAIIEAGKVERVYAESERVDNLRKHVREAKDRYKHELERKFLEAAGRDDIEVAMELMKELDKYLNEGEAAPFLETARGVIGKKRQNLGVQFKLAVHDRDWTAAVRVGEQIIREFPNSKMAGEVRAVVDELRARATGQQAVGQRELV
ncbi:MAG: hypothetical protein WD768_07925 [Phycisphaeraceae bacterium]